MATDAASQLAQAKAAADKSFTALAKPETVPASPAAATTAPGSTAPIWWSTQNAMTMCAVVLLFGVTVLLLATYLMKHGKAGTSVLRIFGTILVITMTTFLVVAGYDNVQLGAPLGLLGTIAGYLLGKDTTGDRPDPPRA